MNIQTPDKVVARGPFSWLPYGAKILLSALSFALVIFFLSFGVTRAQEPSTLYFPFAGDEPPPELIPRAPRQAPIDQPTPPVAGIAEEYYIPLPEVPLLASFKSINTVAQGPVFTVVSIAIGASTVIYYDQHEDGYETNILNPARIFNAAGCPGVPNPTGTQIWGNNNLCDGIPPGFGTVDALSNGNVIVLQNNVPTPNVITYDGGDRFVSSLPVSASRLAYPSNPGSLLAGAVELLDTNSWGTSFRAPVGPALTGDTTNAWEYSALFIMGGHDSTQIFKNGSFVSSVNQGENYEFLVKVGDRITTTNPVQVDLLTGDIGSSYEMRWDSLSSLDRLENEYYMPVGAKNVGDAVVWLFNPHPTDITVKWQVGSTPGSTIVRAGQAAKGPSIHSTTGDRGAKFTSVNGLTFNALAQLDAAGEGLDFDWGFPLVGVSKLSPQALVGYGLACTRPNHTNCLLSAKPITNVVGSYVWVMSSSTQNVPIYVSYAGNNVSCPAQSPDKTITLSPLQFAKIFDPSDLDMTDARIWTCANANLAMAWGQDPETKNGDQSQKLDMGTIVAPVADVSINKFVTVSEDRDGDGLFSPGDRITYTVMLVHNGPYSATLTISDVLPSNVTYVPNSTSIQVLTGPNLGAVMPVPDNAPPASPFPLDNGGLSSLNGQPLVILPTQVAVLRYAIDIPDTPTTCVLPLVNTFHIIAFVPGRNTTLSGDTSKVVRLECDPHIVVEKAANPAVIHGTSGNVNFSVVVTNTGPVAVTITRFFDDVFGDVTKVGGKISSTTCRVGDVIQPNGGRYTCNFNSTLTGNENVPHLNTITVFAVDANNIEVLDSDRAIVTFDENPAIEVIKEVNPTVLFGPGTPVTGIATYTVYVNNIGPGSLYVDRLQDNRFGDVTKSGANNPKVIQTTCRTGTSVQLAVGGTYTCTFSAQVSGTEATPHTNVVTGTAKDFSGNVVTDADDATVTFDTLPTIGVEKSANPTRIVGTGGVVAYPVKITNTGVVSVLLTSLIDTRFGDISPNNTSTISSTTCILPAPIAVGGSYSCEFSAFTSGSELLPHTNVVGAIAYDKDNHEARGNDGAEVTFDELPQIQVIKSASPPALIGTEGTVVFTVTVQNSGPVTVLLTSLNDSAFGDIADSSNAAISSTTCILPVALTTVAQPATSTYSCSFQASVTGSETQPHQDIVTATGEDRDGHPTTDTDNAEVVFDLLPQIYIIKVPDPKLIIGTGGVVTFSLKVQNAGPVTVSLTSLEDSVFGDVTNNASTAISNTSCSLPVELAVGGEYTCAFQAYVTGSETESHTNTITVTGEDDDGNVTDNQDDAVVTFDQLPQIEVLKSATPPLIVGAGGLVTFDVLVQNVGPVTVTLTSLEDSDFGDVTDVANTTISNTTCSLSGTLAVGASYQCSFQAYVTGSETESHTNVITVTGEDDDGNVTDNQDDAEVTFDLLPQIEVLKNSHSVQIVGVGGVVTFDVLVRNTGPVTVSLTSWDDSVFGDISTTANVSSTTCAASGVIDVGGIYTCEFQAFVSGTEAITHRDVVTATAEDGDGTVVSDDDDAVILFDQLPHIEIIKSVNPPLIIGTGGLATFDLLVINSGPVPVTLTDLGDSDFGDLTSTAAISNTTCAVGIVLPVDGVYTCTFQAYVTGSETISHTNTATATAVDNENNQATDDDDAEVIFDLLPQVELLKIANPPLIVGTGGEVVFTIQVRNTGPVTVAVTSLEDDLYGDLTDSSNPAISNSTCSLPVVLDVGEIYTCTFQAFVTGTPAQPHINVATVKAEDGDGNSTDDDDDAEVDFDLLPQIKVIKIANPFEIVGSDGLVTFNVVVENTGPVTVLLTSLTDNVFGNIADPANNQIESTTCDLQPPRTLFAAGNSADTYSCSFQANVSGSPTQPHVNVVTANGIDGNNRPVNDTDDAQVDFTDSIPAIQSPQIDVEKVGNPAKVFGTGGVVIFNLAIRNTGPVTVMLTSLIDSQFGDVTTTSNISSTTCLVPQVLDLAGIYNCSFRAFVTGDEATAHTNVVTATGVGGNGEEASDSDDEVITFDQLPQIEVIKTANPTSLPTGEGVVTFTIQVRNTGPVSVSLQALIDDVFGDLTQNILISNTTCSLPRDLAVGASYTCSFQASLTGIVEGENVQDHVNIVSALAFDKERNRATDTDDARVTFGAPTPIDDIDQPGRPTGLFLPLIPK